MNGICRLCKKSDVLCVSHVIPRFIYEYLKNTSPTGKLRFGTKIDKRVQDGLKLHWLCKPCEQKFSTWENYFKNKIFLPLTINTDKVDYDQNFLKFCVSISWRVLNYFMENKNLDADVLLTTKAQTCLNQWCDFIFDRTETPREHEQHFYNFSGEFQGLEASSSSVNIHRYLQRSIDIGVSTHGSVAYVYTLIPNFLLIGYIRCLDKRKWRDSRVAVKGGTLQPKKFNFPIELWEDIKEKANHRENLKNSISDRQQHKINESYKKNSDKVQNSKTLKALSKDLKVFGTDNVFSSKK